MESEYDPAANRNIMYKRNFFESMLHLFKATSGAGLLAMPKAFAYGGYFLGVIGTILIGLICLYCLRTLVSVQYELCKRYQVPQMTYAETAENSFKEGPWRGAASCMKTVSQVFLLATQLGIACVHMIVISYLIEQIIEFFFEVDYGIRFYLMCLVVPFIFLALVNHLEQIAILSFAADLAAIISFIIMLFYIFDENWKLLPNEAPFQNYANFPLYVGIVMYAVEAIGVALRVEHEMKNPHRFWTTFGVANVTLILMTFLCVLFGYFGHYKYEQLVAGSFTLSLPIEEKPAQFCKILMTYANFISYTRTLFITFDIIWVEYFFTNPEFDNRKPLFIYQFSLRIILIFFSLLLSYTIPNIELSIAFVGCLFLSMSGIAFPAMYNLFCYWNYYYGGEFVVFACWCLIIILVGFLVLIFGVPITCRIIANEYYWSVFHMDSDDNSE